MAKTAPAVQGAGSPERPLPASALKNKGLPDGQRAPVEPPVAKAAAAATKLSAEQWGAVQKPVQGAREGKALRTMAAPGVATAVAAVRGADSLVLRSGYATGDTSLVVYFNLADTAITSWSATVYDAATQQAQQSVTLGQGDLPKCGSPRQFCRGFSGAEGWALDAGRDYFVQITMSYPDGSTQTSASSNNARPRTLGKTPSIPAAQATGCACANALGRTTSGQQLRGMGVNTGTGAYTRVENDLGMSSFAVPFNLTRVYSSSNTSTGVFGNGWASTLDMRVTGTDSGATVRAEDGAQADFTRNADGSYQRPAGVRSNLKKTADGWELTTPEQITHRFDGSGRLVSSKNKRGYGTTLAYNGTQIASVTDAAGRKVAVEYRADLGFISKVALPDGRSTKYDYEHGRLRSFQSATDKTTQYRHDDPNGKLSDVINARGLTEVKNTYHPTTSRVQTQRNIFGKEIKVEWDAAKEEAKVTDQDGVVNYDGYAGNLLKYTQNGNGESASQRYDAQANPNLNIDGNNNQREATFDSAGNMGAHKAPEPFSFTETAEFTEGNKPKTYVDGKGITWRAEYNDFHEMEKRTDGEGHSYEYKYDERGLRKEMKDPRNNVSTYEYHADGSLKAEVTALKRRTEYTYDSTGRLKTVIDPRGFAPNANPAAYTTTYGYDNEDRQIITQDPGKGKPWETRYDDLGRTKTVLDPLSNATIYDYDDADRLVTIKSPRGDLTTYTYTDAGRLKTQANGEGDTTSYSYNNKGVLEKLVTGNGNVPGANAADYTWTFHYDGNNNPVRRTHPNPSGGTVTRDTSWDELDRATTDTDPLGEESKTSYDNNNNVTGVEDQAKSSTKFDYDDNNQTTDVTDSLQGKTHIDYDAAGNPEKQTSATGGVTTWKYNADNQKESEVEPRGNVAGANADDYRTRFEYDLAGNPSKTIDPLGHVTETKFDPLNRLEHRIDANKHITKYTYYDDDQLKTVTAPDATGGQSTSYIYDVNGRLTDVRDPLQHTRTAIYDRAGRVKATTDPLGRYRERVFDAEGNVKESVIARTVADPRNPGRDPERAKHTIVNTYDTLGRRTEAKLGTTGPTYTYGYNAKDQLTNANDPTGGEIFEYYPTGWLKQVKRGDRVFDYTYDTNGNVKSRKFPDGTTVTADYWEDNQIKTLTAGDSAWNFTYDKAGRRDNVKLPAGDLAEKFSYDRAGRLAGVDTSGAAGTVGKYVLDLDPVGNPKKVTTTRGGVTEQVAYDYDRADRLTDACYGAASCAAAAAGKVSYTYDLVGNRKTQTRSGSAGSSSTRYDYDDVDQLRSETTTGFGAGTKAYKYDTEGNQTDEGADRYEYNLDHTLLSATVAGKRTTYAYNGGGQRLTATTGESVRTWDWDLNGGLPQIAVDRAGSDSRTFVHNVSGEPLALRSGGSSSFYAHDWLGGTSAVLSGSGAVQAVYDYDPYGLARTSPTQAGVTVAPSAAASGNPLKFTGQYQDATVGGDYFMRARMYDAGTGTFNSMDPVATGVGQPAVSPYAYVNGRVLRSIDPTGESLGDWLKDKGTSVKNWASEHQSDIVGAAVGIGVGAGCLAATGGTGSIGCAAAGGAAGSAASYAWKTKVEKKSEFSGKEFAKQTAIGGAAGALFGVGGKLAGKAVGAGLSKLSGKGAGSGGGLAGGGNSVAGAGARAGGAGAKAGTAGCRNSFVPGTAVLMADGSSKAIEAVQIGDLVQAAQPETGEAGARPVSALIAGDGDKRLVDITVDTDGAAGEQTGAITATDEHPVWVANTRTWTTAANLKPGDQVLTNDGTARTVLAVSTRTQQQQVHNLTVAGLHTYYVMAGTTPVLVHNCGEFIAGPNLGSLRVSAANPSASEVAAAQHMAARGGNVVLRDPVGSRGTATSDLLVDGVQWDVYTPTTGNVSRIVSAVASKGSQVQGGGVIVDLSRTSVTAGQLANIQARIAGTGGRVGQIEVIP